MHSTGVEVNMFSTVCTFFWFPSWFPFFPRTVFKSMYFLLVPVMVPILSKMAAQEQQATPTNVLRHNCKLICIPFSSMSDDDNQIITLTRKALRELIDEAVNRALQKARKEWALKHAELKNNYNAVQQLYQLALEQPGNTK